MNPQVALLVLKVLDIVIAGVRLAPEIRRKKELYITQIELMIREDRGPTDAEMDALLAEGDVLTEALIAARNAKSVEDGD